jgi:hypothetical protein
VRRRSTSAVSACQPTTEGPSRRYPAAAERSSPLSPRGIRDCHWTIAIVGMTSWLARWTPIGKRDAARTLPHRGPARLGPVTRESAHAVLWRRMLAMPGCGCAHPSRARYCRSALPDTWFSVSSRFPGVRLWANLALASQRMVILHADWRAPGCPGVLRRAYALPERI